MLAFQLFNYIKNFNWKSYSSCRCTLNIAHKYKSLIFQKKQKKQKNKNKRKMEKEKSLKNLFEVILTVN